MQEQYFKKKITPLDAPYSIIYQVIRYLSVIIPRTWKNVKLLQHTNANSVNCERLAPKVMPFFPGEVREWCWWYGSVFLTSQYPVCFIAIRQILTEEQSSKMTSDVDLRKKQKHIIEFLHAEGLGRWNSWCGRNTCKTVKTWVTQFQQRWQRCERQAPF